MAFLKGLLSTLKKRPQHVVPPPRGEWDVCKWTAEDVTYWLALFGLKKRLAKFSEIDGDGLLDMPFEDLNSKVGSKREAKLIIKELMKLQDYVREEGDENTEIEVEKAILEVEEEGDAAAVQQEGGDEEEGKEESARAEMEDEEEEKEEDEEEKEEQQEEVVLVAAEEGSVSEDGSHEMAADFLTACERIIGWYAEHPSGTELTVAAMGAELGVPTTMAYDIMNVFDAMEVVIPKLRKGSGYTWRGTDHVPLLVAKLRATPPGQHMEAKSSGSIGEVARLFVRLLVDAPDGLPIGTAADMIIAQYRDEKATMEAATVEQLHVWLVEHIQDITQILASVDLVAVSGDEDLESLMEPEAMVVTWSAAPSPAEPSPPPPGGVPRSRKMALAQLMFDKPGEMPTPATPRHLLHAAAKAAARSPVSTRRPPAPWAPSPTTKAPLQIATSFEGPLPTPKPQAPVAATPKPWDVEEPVKEATSEPVRKEVMPSPRIVEDRPGTVSDIRSRFERPGRARPASDVENMPPDELEFSDIRSKFERSARRDGGRAPIPVAPRFPVSTKKVSAPVPAHPQAAARAPLSESTSSTNVPYAAGAGGKMGAAAIGAAGSGTHMGVVMGRQVALPPAGENDDYEAPCGMIGGRPVGAHEASAAATGPPSVASDARVLMSDAASSIDGLSGAPSQSGSLAQSVPEAGELFADTVPETPAGAPRTGLPATAYTPYYFTPAV